MDTSGWARYASQPISGLIARYNPLSLSSARIHPISRNRRPTSCFKARSNRWSLIASFASVISDIFLDDIFYVPLIEQVSECRADYGTHVESLSELIEAPPEVFREPELESLHLLGSESVLLHMVRIHLRGRNDNHGFP